MRGPVFTFEKVWKAYLRCRRGKRRGPSALAFELDAERECLALAQELAARTWSPLPSACFVTELPKPREIFAAQFRDRIVHHLLVAEIEPVWERVFIHDSFACRRGKGTLAAVDRLQSFMRQASGNGSRPAWFLQIDIRSFFVSIDKRILFELLTRREEREEVRWLIERIVFHDPAEAPVLRGRRDLFRLIPPHKSLFHTGGRTGLPIGNYTSQFFANVYLNPLDQFVKHELRCRHYVRYVDDLVLVSRDRGELERWEAAIGGFLRDRLALRLHPTRRRLAPVTNGADFLGYVIRPSHRLVRRRTVQTLKEKLGAARQRLVRESDGQTLVRCPPAEVDRLEAMLASYWGIFSHVSSGRLRRGLAACAEWLHGLVRFDGDAVPRRRDRIPRCRNLAAQYGALRRAFPGAAIVLRVGCFAEVYGRVAHLAADRLGLRLVRGRPGLGARCGLPVRSSRRYVRLLGLSVNAVVFTGQTGGMRGHVRERRAWTVAHRTWARWNLFEVLGGMTAVPDRDRKRLVAAT